MLRFQRRLEQRRKMRLRLAASDAHYEYLKTHCEHDAAVIIDVEHLRCATCGTQDLRPTSWVGTPERTGRVAWMNAEPGRTVLKPVIVAIGAITHRPDVNPFDDL